MPRILFIAPHRKDRSPSQRFRYEQYLAALESAGFECEVSHIITEKDDKFFYKPGKFLSKLGVFLRSFIHRWKDARRARHFDIVFVQREAFMTRSTRFERRFARSGAKVVYDFDDSIWLANVSAANRKLNWLKNPGKTATLIGIADLVFAGNNYLANYAKQFNSNVAVVPTTIDTEEYVPIKKKGDSGRICIGWSGSITTIQHFKYALPFLKAIKAQYGDKVWFKVIGDAEYRCPELNIIGMAWSKTEEISALSEFDIGIMPLPDDEWAKGKCGLKGLQYMALGMPTLMSPVGVNTQIINHGENGFLPTSTEDWVTQLSMLIENDNLRIQMGQKARSTVLDRYSCQANTEKYITHFNTLIE